MAKKPSARRPRKSAKAQKSKRNNQIKRKRSVPTKAKGSTRKKIAARSKSKSRGAKPKARPAAKSKSVTKVKAPPRPIPHAAKAARGPVMGKQRMAARSAGRSGGGSQGTLEFETEPAISTYTEPPVNVPPAPRRRSAAKPGSPDWPGESLTVGMMAPEFSLPSTLGRKVTLNEFRGKRVILYFYPKDDTPGCTMEACAFRDHLPRIVSKDAVVLGISLDDELSHQRFAQKYNLPFPLLSDVDAAVSRQYGTYKEKNLYGRSYWGIERTTFVIDREGRVENVFRRVKVEGHAEEVMATLAV
jgi:thioredoxin-dependent peroxiredoxin